MPLKLEDELLQVIAENRTTAVATLLAAGADPNAGLFQDEAALSIAVCVGNEEILDLLLPRGPLCCMKEEHGVAQKPPMTRTRLPLLVLALKGAIIHIAKLSLATYAVRKLAMSLPLGSLQTVGLYGSHYMWFTFHYS